MEPALAPAPAHPHPSHHLPMHQPWFKTRKSLASTLVLFCLSTKPALQELEVGQEDTVKSRHL